ncbi:hypothetical protein R3X27_06615 [Tropicimonas sp. TH_r6]|uniref:hypothetical protein n=1 Tax=Tropicimonas sp. TH_r6 TaxID=3082085 RepID=UPI002954D25A|nr:hypothetical protein [Tropicimonas sp. TH_r6]MDV7142350.1 hypothetical protein [Tropicimonas sp. TH_r6]
MADKDWEGHPLGGVSVFPVTGIKTGTAMEGKAGVVRIEYGTEPSLKKRVAKQFLLNASQVRGLSERLAELADRLDAAQDDNGKPDKVN